MHINTLNKVSFLEIIFLDMYSYHLGTTSSSFFRLPRQQKGLEYSFLHSFTKQRNILPDEYAGKVTVFDQEIPEIPFQ